MTIRDSTGEIQCVAKKADMKEEQFESLKNALIESSVELTGLVKSDDRAPGGHELTINSAEIIGAVNPQNPFPITESAMEQTEGGETEFLLDNRHLYLRTSRMTTMLKIRSTIFGSVHNYFRERDFIEYQAPSFVAGAVEGGSTLLKSHILEGKHILHNHGNYMQKLQCQHWRDFTQSHLLSELKNQELEDILPNSGTLKWKWHGQEIRK